MQSGQPNVLCRLSHSLGLPRHIFPMKNGKKSCPTVAAASTSPDRSVKTLGENAPRLIINIILLVLDYIPFLCGAARTTLPSTLQHSKHPG